MTQKTHIKYGNTQNEDVNALSSFRAIMTVMNKHRLIEPSDFKDEFFIPDI